MNLKWRKSQPEASNLSKTRNPINKQTYLIALKSFLLLAFSVVENTVFRIARSHETSFFPLSSFVQNKHMSGVPSNSRDNTK